MTTIDDEARISEWSKMFAMNTRGETRGDPSYDAAARAVGKWNTVCDTAVALMREFLARAVEAKAENAALKIDSLLAAEPAQTAEPAAPRRCGHRSPGECSIACHTPDVRGLHEKFTVRRTDGRDAPGQKHHGCDYFVLDLNHDEGAPAAIRAYASAVEQTRPQLASDLRSKFGIATLPPAGAAPAGDDESRIAADAEARIAEWLGSAMNCADFMGERLAMIVPIPHLDAGARLMREFLARAVKAEAKLAAAEKARDAALAAQNAKAMEELECLGDRGARWEWMPAGYQREIQLRLAALRSAPPAAPAGEAPAGDDDTLRRFLRRDDAHRGGELLLSVVADLCRRELARGER